MRVCAVSIMLTVAFGLSPPEDKRAPSATPSLRMADGKQWLTQNLSVETVSSYCYENSELNCKKYGGLYAWDSARRGCQSLGGGWRLPTEDEWRQMAKRYGGVGEDSDDGGKAAYKSLLMPGASGFNAKLGGGRSDDGQFARLEAHGFYWTASARDSVLAWFYNFAGGRQALYRQNDGEQQSAFSVRCIRD
jgi:uncharacterized protein (TIGR02145 family)